MTEATRQRRMQRLHAAQASLAVLAAMADKIHTELEPLVDDVLDNFDEPEGLPADRLPGVACHTYTMMERASSAIDTALTTACDAIQGEPESADE